MKITLLGTGTSQGVPIIACQCSVCTSSDEKDKRLRSSVLIEDESLTLCIDSGPDFRQQMLRAKVRKLDGVLFTHGHKDHVAGLDDVRAFNYIQKRPMDIYAENNVVDIIKQEFSYVFQENKYPGVPKLNIHHIDDSPFIIKKTPIIPIRCKHYRLPVLGFRIGDFAYITDANYIPDDQFEKLYGLKVLVITALRKEQHISHFNLEGALQVIKRMKPEQAYLNHISHQMGLHSDVTKELPPNVSLAFDQLEIKL